MADHSIHFNLVVYAPTDGVVFKDKDNTCLGVKGIEISPNGAYMAVLTFDEKLKIYNMVSWCLVTTMDLKVSENTLIFQETDDPSKASNTEIIPKKCILM